MKLRDIGPFVLAAVVGCAKDGGGTSSALDGGRNPLRDGAPDVRHEVECMVNECLPFGSPCSSDDNCLEHVCYLNVCTRPCVDSGDCPGESKCINVVASGPDGPRQICEPPEVLDAALPEMGIDVGIPDGTVSMDVTSVVPHEDVRDTALPVDVTSPVSDARVLVRDDARVVSDVLIAVPDAIVPADVAPALRDGTPAAPDATPVVPDAVPDGPPDARVVCQPMREICNGVDDDCDGRVDDGLCCNIVQVMAETLIGRRVESRLEAAAVEPGVFAIAHALNVAAPPASINPQLFIGVLQQMGPQAWGAPASVPLNIPGTEPRIAPAGVGQYGLKFKEPGTGAADVCGDSLREFGDAPINFALLQDPNYSVMEVDPFPETIHNQQISDIAWDSTNSLWMTLFGANCANAVIGRFYNQGGMLEDECVLRRRDPNEQSNHLPPPDRRFSEPPWGVVVACTPEGCVFAHNLDIVPGGNNGRALELHAYTYDPNQPRGNRCEVSSATLISLVATDNNSIGDVACNGTRCAIAWRWTNEGGNIQGLSLQRFDLENGEILLAGASIPIRPLSDRIGEIAVAALGDDRFAVAWDEHDVQLAITDGSDVTARHQASPPELPASLATVATDGDAIAVCYIGTREDVTRNDVFCTIFRCEDEVR